MTTEPKPKERYSAEFKASIVSLFKSGARTVSQLQSEYGIYGNTTIYRWIKESDGVAETRSKPSESAMKTPPPNVSTDHLTKDQLIALLTAQLQSSKDLLRQERLRSETYLTALNLLDECNPGSSKKKSGTQR